MPKKITAEEFLKCAAEVHNGYYDYSRMKFINATDKIDIVCPKHGLFQQKPTIHVRAKQGCTKCGAEKNGNRLRKPTSIFVEEARRVHGEKYSYDESTYLNAQSPMKIICDIHGEFYQRPRDHLYSKQGCPKCGRIKANKSSTKVQSDIIEEFKSVHGIKYDYSLVEYVNSKTKVKVVCNEHGAWEVMPQAHYRSRSGCPKCSTFSKGELAISAWLSEHGHNFMCQKTFPGCRDTNPLFFDFYLPELKLCIEYDGRQHLIGWRKGQESLNDIKKKDKIKNEYCADNNIHLIRISHKNLKNVEMAVGAKLCEFWLMKSYPNCFGISNEPNNGRLIEA